MVFAPKDILRLQVAPALGCTEPVVVVLAAAGAASLIDERSFESIETHHIAGAISNLIEDLAGVICDGAKPGCALKLATAAGTAAQSALFALQGVRVQATDGITGASPEKTMQNIGTLSREGMIETDRTILKIRSLSFRSPSCL